MAHFVHRDVVIYLGGLDLSGDSNSFTENRVQDAKDDSTFGNSYRRRLAGVRDVSFAAAGFSDFSEGEHDEVLFSSFGVDPAAPLLWAPDGELVGGVCHFGRVRKGQYQVDGSFGENGKYSLAGSLAGGAWIRGRILYPLAEIAAVATGQAVQVGAQGLNKRLYAHLIVSKIENISALVVDIESSAAQNFAAPERRFRFAAVAARAGLIGEVLPAAVSMVARAHEWFRVRVSTFTQSAANPSATFAGAMALV